MAWFDVAVHRPIRANTGGLLSPNLGLVLHHAVMNGSLAGFFGNPAAQVSAHFWVSRTGVIEQYVDSGVVAWHGRSLNSRYCGVETEGCVSPPYAEAMTEPMVAALGRLYAEGMHRHGWPAALANQDGQRGFGFHRMAVQTACPCDVRLNMRTEILRRATGQAPAPPPPEQEEPDMKVIMAYKSQARDGRVFITDGITKRWIGEPGTELPELLRLCRQSAIEEVAQYTIDRFPEILPVGAPDSVKLDLAGLIRSAAEHNAAAAQTMAYLDENTPQ